MLPRNRKGAGGYSQKKGETSDIMSIFGDFQYKYVLDDLEAKYLVKQNRNDLNHYLLWITIWIRKQS